MEFSFLHKPSPKRFEYHPRYYKPEMDPDESGHIPDQSEQFARRLHRSWEQKRTRKEKKQFSKMTLIWFMIIIGVLLFFILR